MIVMLDTNVLVSALFFPSAQTRALVAEITTKHSLVLCDYVLKELRLVVERKFCTKQQQLEEFILGLQFKLVSTLRTDDESLPSVRDKKDTPILAAAIRNQVDVFITGDKDFLVLASKVPKPRIMNMSEFLLLEDKK